MPYKAVEKQTRHCSNWAIYKTHYRESRVLKYRRDHPEWFPRYFKGRTIKEAPGSIGILCFEHNIDALHFIRSYNSVNWLIIQVKGIGKQRDLRLLISGCGCYPERLGCQSPAENIIQPPMGTVLYREVLVLE